MIQEVFLLKILKLDEITSYDINTDNVVSIKQQWSQKCHSWNFIENARKHSGLIYISYGKAVFTSFREKSITANEGDIVYLPADCRYFVKFEPFDSRSMLVDFDISCENREVRFSEEIFIAAHDQNGSIYEMILELCDNYLRMNDKLLIKSELLAIISRLSKLNSCGKEKNPVNNAIFYINHHLNEYIDIAGLSKMCAMSESTFRRCFKAASGVSPKRYINNLRIKKAKQMLANSDASISEICSLLGFYDNAYFTKSFKKIIGKTPAEYRNLFEK